MTWNAPLKIYSSVEDALDGLHSGCTIMVGGFVLTGVPENIINHVAVQANIRDLTIISNDGGRDNFGLGKLYANGQISRHYASYIGKGNAMEQAYLTGETELHLTPQGTLAEKIRGCGAGIPAFFTATGLNTLYAQGKLPVRLNGDGSVAQYNTEHAVSRIGDRDFIFETSFERADFAWVKASRADKMGNCTFKGTSFNFNGIMAKAARTVIVEAEELVEIGDIPPEQVHLPGLYVDRLFVGNSYERRMDLSTACASMSPLVPLAQRAPGSDLMEVRELIARVVAQELVPGTKCNLGVGIPTLAAGYAAEKGVKVFLQGENGVLGCGPYPARGQEDHNWTNAGSESITPLLGASTFGSDESFGQIRGGHLDMTILGALECSQYGDVANFMIPGKLVKGMGGAMDLVSNPESTNVIVVQTHVDKYGQPKIKEKCTLPVTGTRCVRKIITDLAVFDVDFEKGLTMTKYNPSTTVDMIRSKTGAPFEVSPCCIPWEI